MMRGLLALIALAALVAATPMSGPGISPTMLAPGIDNGPASFSPGSGGVVLLTGGTNLLTGGTNLLTE